MKFDIPEKCHIRWQAALAVLEDLQEDTDALFGMESYGSVKDWYKHDCGSAACFAGWMAIAPYCNELGLINPEGAQKWLLGTRNESGKSVGDLTLLFGRIFSSYINKGSRAKTLAYLKRTMKSIFKESTGKTLKAPLTFYID